MQNTDMDRSYYDCDTFNVILYYYNRIHLAVGKPHRIKVG